MVEAEGPVPDTIISELKRNKTGILSLLRPRPEPRIWCEPPFGLDHVPERYLAAWQALLAKWPPGLAPFVWKASICDAVMLFGDFGKVLADYRWPPGDLFDVPHDVKPGGLVWFTPAAGFYPDGRIAEIFLSSHKPGSPIEAIARDAAVRRAPKALPPAWPGSRVAPGRRGSSSSRTGITRLASRS